jgi:hypothetical protein
MNPDTGGEAHSRATFVYRAQMSGSRHGTCLRGQRWNVLQGTLSFVCLVFGERWTSHQRPPCWYLQYAWPQTISGDTPDIVLNHAIVGDM